MSDTYDPTVMIPPAPSSRLDTYIFDMDGTLANGLHRIAHLQGATKDWDAFHAASEDDVPFEHVCHLFTELIGGESLVIICTGRPEKYRAITEAWLAKHGMYPDEILMRPDGDYSQDIECKLKMLDEFFDGRAAAKAATIMIFEDRDSLVEGFRAAGFTVAQVAASTY